MKIAVVGSGVSGLAATWLLNEYTEHEVHLYEADARPGGHANTVKFSGPGRQPVDVDTGFIVFNPSTYPNFIRFLNCYPPLRERIRETPMTFSVSRDAGAFEWAGNSLKSLFCQPARLLDPRMWRMLYDIIRFNTCAQRDILTSSDVSGISIGRYLDREGYSQSFRDNYLLPMTAAIWSTPSDLCALNFPAHTLIQFMHNHHLLQIIGKPSWLTLHGGSRTYVEQILSKLPPSQLHLETAVRSVAVDASDQQTATASRSGVQLTTASEQYVSYDHVILACHSDTALALLRAGGCVTADEERILSLFDWRQNRAVLHYDEQLMPKHRSAWSCWNYLTSSTHTQDKASKQAIENVSVTYWMNALQHISPTEHGDIFVTLNPPHEPDSAKVTGKYRYDHPVLDSNAIKAQREMHLIQNKRGVSFAGAWLKYGFHEDGFTSGLRAATALTKSDAQPFEVSDSDRQPHVSTEQACLACLFDAMERTRMRALFGLVLGWLLSGLRAVVAWVGINLTKLERELAQSRVKSAEKEL